MQSDPAQRWLRSNDINLNIQRILHRYHTAALGGLLPASIPLTNVQHILNTSCGPGD